MTEDSIVYTFPSVLSRIMFIYRMSVTINGMIEFRCHCHVIISMDRKV